MSRFILKRKLYAFINPTAIGGAIKNAGTAVMNVAKPLAVGTAVPLEAFMQLRKLGI